MKLIDNAQVIVEDIVRCKHCNNFHFYKEDYKNNLDEFQRIYDGDENCGFCYHWGADCDANDFCSYGKGEK